MKTRIFALKSVLRLELLLQLGLSSESACYWKLTRSPNAMRLKILEEFDGQVGGIVADGDHGDEVIGADADDGDVAGVVIDDEEKIFLGIEAQR